MDRAGMQEIWGENGGVYDQNTLYTCMEFSKSIFKDRGMKQFPAEGAILQAMVKELIYWDMDKSPKFGDVKGEQWGKDGYWVPGCEGPCMTWGSLNTMNYREGVTVAEWGKWRRLLLDRKCQMIDPSEEGLNSSSGKGSSERRFGFKGEL